MSTPCGFCGGSGKTQPYGSRQLRTCSACKGAGWRKDPIGSTPDINGLAEDRMRPFAPDPGYAVSLPSLPPTLQLDDPETESSHAE